MFMIQGEDAQCVHTLIPKKLYTVLHAFETLSRDYGNNHPMLIDCSKINFPQSQSFKKKRRTCMFDRQNIDIRSNLLFLNVILSFKGNTGQRVKNTNPKQTKNDDDLHARVNFCANEGKVQNPP